jgi:hypothetical protein
MVWSNTDINNLILVSKDLYIHLSESICNKLDLGKPITTDMDMLYLLCDVVFALEHDGTDVIDDAGYSYLAEIVDRIDKQRNRFRII